MGFSTEMRIILIASIFVAGGCSFTGVAPTLFLKNRGVNNQQAPSEFTVCYSHACYSKTKINLSEVQLQEIDNLFIPKPNTAEQERKQISAAIGKFERFVGEINGTSNDVAGSFPGFLRENQLDCEDETTNTISYIMMLEDKGLTTFHKLSAFQPARRSWFLNGWPHMAAIIEEKKTSNLYVVDSWFMDNGNPAYIISYNKWKDGWHP